MLFSSIVIPSVVVSSGTVRTHQSEKRTISIAILRMLFMHSSGCSSESLANSPSGERAFGHSIAVGEHRFNDDLLLNDGDLEHARQQFPTIFHALDHPELRETFRRHDAEANHAREWVRILGVATVVGATSALLIALIVAAVHGSSHAEGAGNWVADITLAVVEVIALLCAAVAAGGMWLGPWKRRWLENRIVTEQLRQWHFQLLVRRAAELQASCQTGDPLAITRFQQQRSLWFRDFLHSFKPENLRAELIDDLAEIDPWLHPQSGKWEPDSPAFLAICEAYAILRFDHQYNYAVYKLREDADQPFWRFLKWPAAAQHRLVENCWSFCFVLALICSASIVVAHVLLLFRIGAMEPMLPGMYIAAIGSAILGVGLRTAAEGLGFGAELSRYRRYRHAVASMRSEFENNDHLTHRVRCMERMEVAVFDEMRDFIRIHNEARFVI